jgi:hypothetical protein
LEPIRETRGSEIGLGIGCDARDFEAIKMKLYIADEYQPEELRQELISDGLEQYEDCFRIWDGRWQLMPLVCWYRKTPGERLEQQREYAIGSGWFFYSMLSLRLAPSSTNPGSPAYLELGVTFDEAIRQTVEIILQGDYRPFKDSPSDFPENQREKVAREVRKMQLSYPAYPAWCPTSFPFAVFGDPAGVRRSAGSIFVQFNDEFSIEVWMDAFLDGDRASAEELQQIKESLNE